MNLFPKILLCSLFVGISLASTINCADQTAGPNGTGGSTFDKYVALGAGGCYMNGVLFANFAYSYTMGTDIYWVSGPKGNGTQQNASAVQVGVNALNEKFDFGANWVVDHYQTASLTLSYTILAPPLNQLNRLTSNFVASQAGTQNGGPTSTRAATCVGATCGGATDFTNVTTTITPTTGPVTITNTVFMNAMGSTPGSTNLYHLSVIQNQFAQTAPPGQIPEPMSYMLTGAGVGILALLRRRRQV